MPSKIRGGTADKHLADMHIPRVSALGAGGGAAAFVPSDITGLQIWLQPSNVAQADNTAISSVTMSVGGNATQGTGAAQPTWQDAELNGYGVIRYDGGDYLSTSVAATQKPLTWFAVVNATNFTAARSIAGSSNNSDGLLWRLDTTSGKQNLSDQNAADIGTSTTGVTAATWTIIACTYSATGAFAFYLAGTADGTGTSDKAFAAGNVFLGFAANTTSYFLGDIAEMLRYDTVLSTANLNNVGSYLATKYGLTWTGV